MVRNYFHSSIAHLKRYLCDGKFLWIVNSCGHFSMVITNVANPGGARLSNHCTVSGQGVRGAKPLLGSVNTFHCQDKVELG